MYKVNDYVVYGATGVCLITDIVNIDYADQVHQYYVLQPVYNNSLTIKTPVNNNLMRPLLTKEEVLSLITAMPGSEICWIDDQRERNNIYKTMLKSNNNEDLIKIIKTLYLKKQAKSVANKKLTKTDEEIMYKAEQLLYEEFAIALGITPDEVLPFISAYLDKLEKNKAVSINHTAALSATKNSGQSLPACKQSHIKTPAVPKTYK